MQCKHIFIQQGYGVLKYINRKLCIITKLPEVEMASAEEFRMVSQTINSKLSSVNSHTYLHVLHIMWYNVIRFQIYIYVYLKVHFTPHIILLTIYQSILI